MPNIFDNIDKKLLEALNKTLATSQRADMCAGYFNLRGWKSIDAKIEALPSTPGFPACRVLVGMQRQPEDDLRSLYGVHNDDELLDQTTMVRRKRAIADDFRRQLTIGQPTAGDEAGLRTLSAQLRSGKLVVKLYLNPKHRLHAKLYLFHRADFSAPIVAYLGSSNLTLSGLSGQGELNIDVVDGDAAKKLAAWFEDRWTERESLDISAELADVIDESWAREKLPSPYQIYVKMAYHLAQEARDGIEQFTIPAELRGKLFEFQAKAVQIAAHHVNKRGGVLIGDVVGLGKSIMATALARVLEDDMGYETLIVCPKNLQLMWQKDYVDKFRLRAKVVPITRFANEAKELRRYRVVLIDESHNLRNREGKRYKALHDYIRRNDSKCILLSATPYNKTYLDLSSQLRLFVPEDQHLGIRPEALLRDIGVEEFNAQYQSDANTLAAFEKSSFADDWRELMRLYMIRRTRGFVKDAHAETDPVNGRKFLTFPGTQKRSYFPDRIPKTETFVIDASDPTDQFAQLFTDEVVSAINGMLLPRYGLGQYINAGKMVRPTALEKAQLDNLGRAGKRLMGFCRTNLFKRLESSGRAFLLSIERHALRNYIFIHALENDLPLPIGTQGAELLDTRVYDEDADDANAPQIVFDLDEDQEDIDEQAQTPAASSFATLKTEAEFKRRAAEVYTQYQTVMKRRFKWLRPALFTANLTKHLQSDAAALLKLLQTIGDWRPADDRKLAALHALIQGSYPTEKVLVFSQFADTVDYVADQLAQRGVSDMQGVTGDSDNPTELAWRFSPISNERQALAASAGELRVLIATDVLSEGQNLQDAHVVVNFDLPWAIIRLIQRAGRVDRIGQQADKIVCHTFLPAEGVERLLHLRDRIRKRLRENAEVVGTDEAFFDDDNNNAAVANLYNEQAGIFDGDADKEVDLTSHAYQIWREAILADPSLERRIPALPSVIYSAKQSLVRSPTPNARGVLAYLRTSNGNDALAWLDEHGQRVTESQLAVLSAAQCLPDTPAQPRLDNHHALVTAAVMMVAAEERSTPGGQLGRPNGARYKTYQRLKRLYETQAQGTLFERSDAYVELNKAINELYQFPLRSSAVDTLNRQLRAGISDEQLAEIVLGLRADDRLCVINTSIDDGPTEPEIVCSLGLV